MNCPECQNRYADDASYCPHCGRPNPAWTPRRASTGGATRNPVRETPAQGTPAPQTSASWSGSPTLEATASSRSDPQPQADAPPEESLTRVALGLLFFLLVPILAYVLFVVIATIGGGPG